MTQSCLVHWLQTRTSEDDVQCLRKRSAWHDVLKKDDKLNEASSDHFGNHNIKSVKYTDWSVNRTCRVLESL